MSIDEAARRLGVGKNQAYQAARYGQIPVIRIGKRILVLRKPFERMLRGDEFTPGLTAAMEAAKK
jgi:excisionase family DNA binding protein